MNAGTRPYGPYETRPTPYLELLAIGSGVFISAPAVLLGVALARVARWARMRFSILAALGLGWAVYTWPLVETEMHRAARAVERAGAFEHPHEAIAAAWPHIRTWWLLGTPLCFAVALGIELMRRRSVEELRERDERRAERSRAKSERRARRALGARHRRARLGQDGHAGPPGLTAWRASATGR